jgi:nucleoside phosphorylase
VCSHNNIRCAIIKVVSDNIFNKEKNEEAWKENVQTIGKTINQIFADASYSLIYNNQKRKTVKII